MKRTAYVTAAGVLLLLVPMPDYVSANAPQLLLWGTRWGRVAFTCLPHGQDPELVCSDAGLGTVGLLYLLLPLGLIAAGLLHRHRTALLALTGMLGVLAPLSFAFWFWATSGLGLNLLDAADLALSTQFIGTGAETYARMVNLGIPLLIGATGLAAVMRARTAQSEDAAVSA